MDMSENDEATAALNALLEDIRSGRIPDLREALDANPAIEAALVDEAFRRRWDELLCEAAEAMNLDWMSDAAAEAKAKDEAAAARLVEKLFARLQRGTKPWERNWNAGLTLEQRAEANRISDEHIRAFYDERERGAFGAPGSIWEIGADGGLKLRVPNARDQVLKLPPSSERRHWPRAWDKLIPRSYANRAPEDAELMDVVDDAFKLAGIR
jgi:hypothetical protein